MLVDSIRDQDLRSNMGVDNILAIFNMSYRDFLQIEKGGNFEKVFFDTPRKSDEQYVAYYAQGGVVPQEKGRSRRGPPRRHEWQVRRMVSITQFANYCESVFTRGQGHDVGKVKPWRQGIGGAAATLFRAVVPLDMGSIAGLIQVVVVDQDQTPLPIPIGLLRGLKARSCCEFKRNYDGLNAKAPYDIEFLTSEPRSMARRRSRTSTIASSRTTTRSRSGTAGTFRSR